MNHLFSLNALHFSLISLFHPHISLPNLSLITMAARSLFLTLARNVSRQGKTSIRSLSSTNEVTFLIQDDQNEEVKDDLKSRIFRLRLPKRSATNVLERWVSEGNKIAASDLRSISRELRRSQRYKHALEISEWMVSHEEYDLSDSDFAVRIDLMTKVFGIDAAERYFEALPPSLKSSETYTSLLHAYAASKLINKAEKLFERIKEAVLPLTAITYNELMTLYMSVGQPEKVSATIEDLRAKNVAPDLFTYNLWVSSCAATLNIDEAIRVLDEMRLDSGCNEVWLRYIKLAEIYITSAQLMNTGMNPVIESEKEITQRELITYDFLVILYGGLGNKDKLDHIWKSLRMTQQKMTGRNYVCIISSYLMLGHLKEVGEIIDQWQQSATLEFDISGYGRLVKAFEGAGLSDKATGFRSLLVEKGYDVTDGL